MKLNERQRAILAAVIERYVETAEPVGSAALAGDAGMLSRVGVVSSATIRNELAELENLGLLAHPHTSAGRVPTDAGYRLYVNEMLRPRAVKPQERAQIHAQISTPASSVEDVLRDACAALAKLTGYPAVATLPHAARDTVRQVQINNLPPRRLMLALVTQTGRIEHRVFEVEDVPDERLATVVNFLNQTLSGRTLSSLRVLDFAEISEGLHGAETMSLASRAFEFVKQSAEELGDERIVVQGLITLLDEPEFSDIVTARRAMRLFEDAGAMNDLLQAPLELFRPESGYSVVIGHELSAVENAVAQRFSVVGIAYGLGDEVLGTVAVMGPTRMKYADAVSLAPVLAQRLKSSLETL